MNRKRLTLAGLFGFAVVFTILMLGGAASADAIYIKSRHRNFDNDEAGAWRITKSAEWTGKGKAKLTLKAESNMFDAGGAKDVVFILDTSKSMEEIIDPLKSVIKIGASDVLSNSNNTVSLITFNTSAQIVQTMTNNGTAFNNAIDRVGVAGDTNYYDAIVKLEELLSGYQEQAGRKLVVAFISDGCPSVQTPLEVSEYRYFKSLFPNSVVNGVQYYYSGVLEQLKAVSDYQVVIDDYSDVDKLREKFMEALWTAYNYETFNIRDVVDTDYFTIDDVEATLGEASVSGDIVTWNMDGIYRTGTEEELTINITLKNQYLSGSQNVFNPNKSTNVKTSAADIPNEDVANTGSPELTLRYDVKYEANAPGSCTVSSALPAKTREIVFDVVAISDNKPQCEGYHFKQWVIANDGVRRINDDYFLMPDEDVTLRAMWEKITIDKTTDGDIYGTNSATLGNGNFVNARLKALANSGSGDYYAWDRNIKAIKYATSLPADFTPSSSNTISARNSKLPIYAWFDNTDGTIYFYSPAEKIETGTDISGLAHYMEELNDISGLSVIDVSNVRQMSYVFEGCGALADLSPLADWNVSNVTNMLYMFNGNNNTTHTGSIVDVDVLSDWDVSSVTDMSGLFRSQGSLSDIEGLRNWNISSVEKFDYVFYKTSSLTDLSPLSDWAQRFGSATSFNFMFYGCAASNYSPLADWDVSTVIDFIAMFEESGIVNLSSLEDWNVSSGVSFGGMFEKTDVADLTGISGWDVHNAKNMNSMFEYTKITDLTKISGWDVSSVSTLSDTFAHTPLTTLDGLDAWKTKISSLTSLSGAFSYNYQLTDISDIADWPIGGVHYLGSLFEGDIKLTGTSIMALKDWDVSGILNISYMFDKCIRIDSLEALRDWDVRSVMDMRRAFSGMHALTSLEPLSGWITSSLTNMISTFSARIDDSTFRRETGYSTMDSSALTSLHGLEGWDVDGVTTMFGIFGYNNGLSDISALSGWHTDSLTTSADAFRRTSITSVEAIRGWNMSSVTNVSDMFNGDLVITSLSPLNDWTFDNSPTMLRTFNDVNASLARPYWYHE